MSYFIVRVELYGTPSEDVYNRLHNAMEQKGFSRTFTEGNQKLQFPHAVYCLFQSNLPTTQVVELAKQAAATAWKDFAVLVASTEVRWEYYNLKPAK